ncbi:flagellar hook-length control protein FliK [Caloramator australicus]|uniref:Putative flagellar protein n=1 Tax=Caloramator australicus RC3 TaxID=857293 RepID=I7J4H5_9CLOT|nr:flagellar hook-length control protein FliK [Caloramator australicus]CCJ32601.1 putative flagellar protein [Caloramator australicus RC3]
MKVEAVKLKDPKLEAKDKNPIKGDDFEKVLDNAANNLALSQGKNIESKNSKVSNKLSENIEENEKEELLQITDETINLSPNVQLIFNQIFNVNDKNDNKDTSSGDNEISISVQTDKLQPTQEKIVLQEKFNLINIDMNIEKTVESEELPNLIAQDEIKETITDFDELLKQENINETTSEALEDEKQIFNSEEEKYSEKTISIEEKDNEIKTANSTLDHNKDVNILNLNIDNEKKAKENLFNLNQTNDHEIKTIDVKSMNEKETNIDIIEPQVKEVNVPIRELTTKHLKDEIQRIISPAKAEEIVNITVEKFKSLRLPDITEVKVKLKPEALGEITVRVVLEKGEIKGNIIVEKKEVALVLQNNIENMKQELRQNNVNLSNISVYLSSDGFNENAGRNFKDFARQNRQHNLDLDFEEDIFEEELEGINLYA